jgi:hypothetical protein
MFTGRVTGGCSGVLPGNSGEGTVIWGVDLVQDLVGRVDDVRPQREVLSKGELHSGIVQKEREMKGDRRESLQRKGTFVY